VVGCNLRGTWRRVRVQYTRYGVDSKAAARSAPAVGPAGALHKQLYGFGPAKLLDGRAIPCVIIPTRGSFFLKRLAENMAASSPTKPQTQGGSLNVVLAILGLVMIVAGVFFIPHVLGTVEIKASPIFHIGSFAVSNSLFTGWISLLILAITCTLATRNMSLVPSGLQNFVEWVIESLAGLAENVAGRAKGREFFTVFATIFLYVVVNNWLEVLPGFTNATVWVGTAAANVPLFRSPSADLNFTLALALSSVVMVQVWSIRHTGVRGWAGKFFNFKGGPIMTVVGILELVSEFSRIISFTFRLFGNMFAGEVLLSVMSYLVPLVLVLPFLGLELFVGVIQALIFSLLTIAFAVIATVSHDGGGHDEATAH
jgi:F-type H+-transporting ATPase subunit a